VKPVPDATADFFERLSRRGHEPRFGTASGTLRVERVNGGAGDSWLVRVENGDVGVSHKRGKADCTIRASDDVLDAVVRGELNAMAAVLRGAVDVEGDSKILIRFQRLFPGPPQDR
jgi:putative sterol carrier protein